MVTLTGRDVMYAFMSFNGGAMGKPDALKHRKCGDATWYVWSGRAFRELTTAVVEIQEAREKLAQERTEENADDIDQQIRDLDKQTFELNVKPYLVKLLGRVEMTPDEAAGLAPLLSGELEMDDGTDAA